MARNLHARLLRFRNGAILTALLSLAVGYGLFLGVFPNLSFPASGDASIPLILAVIAVTALIAGFAAEDLVMAATVGVLSVLLGIVVASLMVVSPVFGGMYLFDVGFVPAFLVHWGFVFLILAFTVNVAFTLGGYALRERYIIIPPSPLSPPGSVQRK